MLYKLKFSLETNYQIKPLASHLLTGRTRYYLASIACFRRDLKLLEVLLKNGAKADVVLEYDNHHTTPLHIACSLGEEKMAKTLLQYGADLKKITSEKCTSLILACDHNQGAVVALLLSQQNIRDTLDLPAKDGATPFIRAFTKGYLPIARQLLQAGADGIAWVYYGCRNGNVGLIDFLVVDPKVRQNINTASNGITPLMMACMFGHVKVAASLLTAGADLTSIASDVLLVTCERGSSEMLTFLLNQPIVFKLINEPFENGFTPMTFASANERVDLVAILIKSGARVSQADKNGYTPEQWAKERKNSVIIAMIEAQLLIEQGKTPRNLTFAYQNPQVAEKVDFTQRNTQAIKEFKAENYLEAARLFEECLGFIRKSTIDSQTKQNLPTVLYNLGSAQLKLGSYEAAKSAVEHLTEAGSICGDDVKEKYGVRLKEAEKNALDLKPQDKKFEMV